MRFADTMHRARVADDGRAQPTLRKCERRLLRCARKIRHDRRARVFGEGLAGRSQADAARHDAETASAPRQYSASAAANSVAKPGAGAFPFFTAKPVLSPSVSHNCRQPVAEPSEAPFGLGEFCRTPCLPAPEQRGAWLADRLIQEFGGLHPIGAEMAKALT